MISVRKGEDPPRIVAGSVWERIEPLLPKVERRSRSPGRRRLDDRIGRRGVGHGSGLGKHRSVGERTIALLHWCRRLRIRWEIRDDIHEAFLSLAAALICWRRPTR
jgi:hypothetical protein